MNTGAQLADLTTPDVAPGLEYAEALALEGTRALVGFESLPSGTGGLGAAVVCDGLRS